MVLIFQNEASFEMWFVFFQCVECEKELKELSQHVLVGLTNSTKCLN
jgi:hypothetical protein